jgi:hypothetical protein
LLTIVGIIGIGFGYAWVIKSFDMKNLLLAAMVVGASFLSNKTEAQVRVNVNLNIGRPSWGLPGNQVGDYYYLPEIDTYYDIAHRQFVYFDRGRWAYASALPYQYRGYDLARGYKVIVNEPRPFMRADWYRNRYKRYYNTYRAPMVMADKRNDRFDNDRFDRGRDNQRFDNRRDDNDRNDDRGNGNGKWKSDRGRG